MNIFILDGELSCLGVSSSIVSSTGGVQSIKLLSVSCKASALSSTFCHGHGEQQQLSPCAHCLTLSAPSARGSSTQRCLPFMGWNLGGIHRGDGETPSAVTLIYCMDARNRMQHTFMNDLTTENRTDSKLTFNLKYCSFLIDFESKKWLT